MTRIAVIGAGISGLATAFSIEQMAQSLNLDVELNVSEKRDRIGGKILSIKEQGYLCEWGPNGFLDNKPNTLDLCRDLRISERLLRSNDNARKRFIYSGGLLNRLPENGPSFLASKLISWPGKIRLACEMMIPKRTDDADETLADFGRRRLGDEALDKLIAPMVSGIFAGDPEVMSLRSCFPRIHELESTYGGLLRAMILLARKKRAERKAGKVVASAAGPGGVLTSFREGIQELTDAAGQAIGGKVRTNQGIAAIEAADGGYVLNLEDGLSFKADVVVLASPAFAQAQMLRGLDADIAAVLDQIPYAPMNVICFGYERRKIERDLDGFGYLIPKKEGKSILGTLWDSSIFENRAPEGQVLLRSMMGGAANVGAIELSEEEVTNRVMADLEEIMGITASPDFARVFRHERAIPQYTVGHAQRLAAIDTELGNHPGLFLTGNAFLGVGLNDCVNAASRTAQKVLDYLQRA